MKWMLNMIATIELDGRERLVRIIRVAGMDTADDRLERFDSSPTCIVAELVEPEPHEINADGRPLAITCCGSDSIHGPDSVWDCFTRLHYFEMGALAGDFYRWRVEWDRSHR